jgi:hypothetical protein
MAETERALMPLSECSEDPETTLVRWQATPAARLTVKIKRLTRARVDVLHRYLH